MSAQTHKREAPACVSRRRSPSGAASPCSRWRNMAVPDAEVDATSAPEPLEPQLDLVIVGAGPHALSLLCPWEEEGGLMAHRTPTHPLERSGVG